ncbi:uncharacterized protein [Drosophila virilis]|uniref:CHK kinase-like domain-containing protein n=1 Tax=Drosophila virilis TaxID=7244 RepID=B4LUM0_DROVI|nr:uncharacterized protein LOC6628408 [Drosophila virilis]EDW64206.1 uncharacterized protein Dvir_GJ17337 [Drosophila virilis]
MSEDIYNPVLTRANRLELFTLDECENILKAVLEDQNEKGSLKEFEIVPAIENMGFLGEYYHLILSYQLEKETAQRTMRLFVKSVAYENANMSYYEEKSSIIKKEAKLYGLLLNELKNLSAHVWCAKCYFTRDDLFVMQNIEDLGYRSLPSKTRFLSEQELRPMIKALATLHASSVAYERRHRLTIGVVFREWLLEKSIDPDIVWWTTGLKAVLAVAAAHPRVLKDAAAQDYVANELPRCLDRVYFMANPSPVHRNVFLHRDAWGGNVFYHKEHPQDVGCVLVDFQLCRYAPPAVDLLMASYLNVEPAQRKQMMERITGYYYEHLVAELTDMDIDAQREQLSRADFDQSLQDFALFGATYNCIAATILRLPENYLKQLKDEQPMEFHRFCNVDRTEAVLRLMDEHEDFKCYIYDCIEDLLELTYYKQAK